jgi:hypothetical protein
MPFTGSHPAAVLPLMRWGLVPSALVIGSMSPDLPYYLPLPAGPEATLSRLTHTAGGVFGLDLAIGALALVVWLVLVAPLAIAAAPLAVRSRLPAGLPVPWRRYVTGPRTALMLVLSLWIGAATHVLWDEFTHIDRWGYRNVAWLAAPHGPLEGYRWAQYGSGLLGGLLIADAIGRWWRRTAPAGSPAAVPSERGLSRRAATLVWAAIGLAAGVGAVAGGASGLLGNEGLRRALFRTATWGGGGGMLTALVLSLLLLALPRPPQTGQASPVDGRRTRSGRGGRST